MASLLFSEKGLCQNVTLNKKLSVATWNIKDSGGLAYSACALQPGKTVIAVADGSGHCEIGIIKEKPNVSRLTPLFKQLNLLRIHKKKCSIHFELNHAGTEVISYYEGGRVSKKIEKEAWLVVYIKFGNIAVELIPKDAPTGRLLFNRVHGKNIQLSNEDRTATTVYNNPDAICFLRDKITRGEIITLNCSPIKEKDCREPSRYYLKIIVSQSEPSTVKDDYTMLEVLEKEQCNGNISLLLVDSKYIVYVSASNGKQNTQMLNFDVSDGCWVGFELFRVSVEVIERKPPESSGSNPGVRQDVPDGYLRDPSNIAAENSIAPVLSFNTHRQPSPKNSNYSYASITEVKEIYRTRNICRNANGSSPALPAGTKPLRCGNKPLPVDTTVEQRLERIEQKLDDLSTCVTGSPPEILVSNSPTISVDSDDMVRLDIQQNWVKLVQDMRADKLVDHLFEKGIISDQDMSRVLNMCRNGDTQDANRHLLRTLQKKSIRKSLLLDILEKAEESHVKQYFFPDQ